MAAEQPACCGERLFRLVAAHDGIQATAECRCNALLKTIAALSMKETPLAERQRSETNMRMHAHESIIDDIDPYVKLTERVL